MRFDNQPLISVIVPVYKVEAYLSRCVESIQKQSYRNLEIILVDDGSPDKCPEICDSFQKKDNRVAVIHKENGGLSSARNAGIRMAKGKYLSFVDSDDYIENDLIEQLVFTALSNESKLTSCNLTSNEDLLQKGLTEKSTLFSAEEALREIFQDGSVCTTACAKLYYRDLFRDISFPEGLLYEDYGTIYKLVHKAGKVALADTRKYFYTYNESGITKGRFSRNQMDFFIISDEIELFAQEHYPSLLRLVQNRKTDVAVFLFLKVVLSDGENQFVEEKQRLIECIRGSCFSFFSSKYPTYKKIAALLISFSPKIAEAVLKFYYTSFSRRCFH